jgi:dsRNA-specific ribonuclease
LILTIFSSNFFQEIPAPSRSNYHNNHQNQQSSSSTSTTIKSNLNPASVPFVPSAGKSTNPKSPVASPVAVSAAVKTAAAVAVKTASNVPQQNVTKKEPATTVEQQQNISISTTTAKPEHIYDELKSPISLVHENALKREMNVKFEVARETGPPHLRTFLTRCLVGKDFATEGEGNGKKTSKNKAAELMLDKLRQLPPLALCQLTPPKKKTAGSAAAAAKKKSKNLIKLEQKASPDYGQSINPISRLIQIQQAKKQKEPVYTLIAERGMPRRREFVMKVSVILFILLEHWPVRWAALCATLGTFNFW